MVFPQGALSRLLLTRFGLPEEGLITSQSIHAPVLPARQGHPWGGASGVSLPTPQLRYTWSHPFNPTSWFTESFNEAPGDEVAVLQTPFDSASVETFLWIRLRHGVI